MVSDSKIFPIMLLRQLNFGVETPELWSMVGLATILCLLQRKNSAFLYSVVFIVA